METALRFSGYLGLVVFLFGLLGSFIVGSFVDNALVTAHLVIGILMLIAWGVTSGVQSMSKAGEVLTGRTARFGANAVAYSVVFLGLLIVANIALVMNDKRWDLTEAGVYSLSEKSIKIVRELKQPVRFVALDLPQMQDKGKTKELLELYKYHNPSKVSYEILDPRAKPVELDRLGFKQGNLLYIQYGDKDNKAISRIGELEEGAVTTAIIKLTRGAAKRVYYITGHGEPEITYAAQGGMREFADALKDEQIEIEGLVLPQVGKIPEDAAAVILAAPQKPLPQQEQDTLVAYGNNGGRLLLFADAEQPDSTAVGAVAQSFGITVGRDVIIDQQLRLFAGPELAVQFVAQQFSQHPITKGLSKAQPPVFSFASSVTAKAPSDDKNTYTELLKSGPQSWAEKNVELLFDPDNASAALEPGDTSGPVSIAVALDRKLPAVAGATPADDVFERRTRVVVFGDTTWLTNGSLAAMANRDVVLNAVNWAVGEEGGVAIGPKQLRAAVDTINQQTFNFILAMSFLGPEFILLFGLFVWWRRRVVLA